MSTLDTAALWSATSLAFDEKKIGAAGLSVRQRKLLALLAQPASVQQLAQTIALPIEEVHSALERFAKLGFAKSDGVATLDPMQARVTTITATPISAKIAASQPAAASRMPVYVGAAVAGLALVAASAWLLRGGSSGPSPGATAAAPAAKAPAPTATGPADTADINLPRAATAAAPAAPATNTAPVAAATTAAVANAASAAAKAAPATPPQAVPANAKTAATPAAPSAAATSPPAATVAPSAATAAAPPVLTPTLPAVNPAPAPAAVAPAAPAAAAPAPTSTPPAIVAAAPAVTAPPAAAKAAPAAPKEIKLVNRVEPRFPAGLDADRGTVRARLQVDARGNVTGVDIVEANPPRVFDRVVRSALQQWRYEATGEAFSTIAEVSFSR
jgi:TonB family protein